MSHTSKNSENPIRLKTYILEQARRRGFEEDDAL